MPVSVGQALVKAAPERLVWGSNWRAFGGKDRRTLYLTTLGSLYRVQMLAEGLAGRSK